MIKGPGIGLRKAERVSQRSTATSARCSFFLAIRVQHRRRWKARFRKPPPTFKAVKDIDLDIQDGEFTVLVGPSGLHLTRAPIIVNGSKNPVAWRFHSASFLMPSETNPGLATRIPKSLSTAIAGRSYRGCYGES